MYYSCCPIFFSKIVHQEDKSACNCNNKQLVGVISCHNSHVENICPPLLRDRHHSVSMFDAFTQVVQHMAISSRLPRRKIAKPVIIQSWDSKFSLLLTQFSNLQPRLLTLFNQLCLCSSTLLLSEVSQNCRYIAHHN